MKTCSGFKGYGWLVALGALLFACSPVQQAPHQPAASSQQGVATSPSTGPKVVRIAVGSEPESRDPYGHSTTTAYGTWMQVMEPLVDYDFERKAVVPVLAESWENPDPMTWRFHLRRGVKFHDGSDFTSKDVVHSITRMKTDPISKQGGNFAAIEQIVAVDDSTVDLKSQEPFAPLLFNLISRVMTSKAAYDQYGTDNDRYLVGTAPIGSRSSFRASASWSTRNPDYWGEPGPDRRGGLPRDPGGSRSGDRADE